MNQGNVFGERGLYDSIDRTAAARTLENDTLLLEVPYTAIISKMPKKFIEWMKNRFEI